MTAIVLYMEFGNYEEVMLADLRVDRGGCGHRDCEGRDHGAAEAATEASGTIGAMTAVVVEAAAAYMLNQKKAVLLLLPTIGEDRIEISQQVDYYSAPT